MEKNKKRLTETLVTGKDSTKKLQALLRRRVYNGGSVSVEDDLLMEILGSFSGALLLLRSSDSGEFSGVPASPEASLTYSGDGDRSPEVNAGKKPASAVKERRGCYKRRRTIDSKVKICATIEDGHAWRKYGQKMILNSKSPRCYYRCTHKPDYGCKALKQVQQMEDDSNMFHITYFGHHTCPTLKNVSHSEVVLDFNDSKNHHSFSNSPSTITNIQVQSSIKQEVDSKTQSTDASDNVSSANDGQYSSPGALGWNEMIWGNHVGIGHEDEPFMWPFENEDSCASTSSHGFLHMHFLNKDDFSSGDFIYNEGMS